MAFIKPGFPDYDELVPEGVYQLRIVGHRDMVSRAGNPMTQVDLRVEGKQAVFHHYLIHPTDDLTPDQQWFPRLQIKRFLVCFAVPYTSSGFDTEDLYGATATFRVTQEKDKYGTTYNRAQIPRLKAEDGG